MNIDVELAQSMISGKPVLFNLPDSGHSAMACNGVLLPARLGAMVLFSMLGAPFSHAVLELPFDHAAQTYRSSAIFREHADRVYASAHELFGSDSDLCAERWFSMSREHILNQFRANFSLTLEDLFDVLFLDHHDWH